MTASLRKDAEETVEASGIMKFGPFIAYPAAATHNSRDDSLEVVVLGQTVTVPKALLAESISAPSAHASILVDTRSHHFSLGLDGGGIVTVQPMPTADIEVPTSSILKLGDAVHSLECQLGEVAIKVTDPADVMSALEWKEWTTVTATFKGTRVRLLFRSHVCIPCVLNLLSGLRNINLHAFNNMRAGAGQSETQPTTNYNIRS